MGGARIVGMDTPNHQHQQTSDGRRPRAVAPLRTQTMLTKHVRELDDATFQDHINQATRPVLVDFWAPWCPPCRILAPTIEAIAEQFDGRADVAQVDIDRSPETASAHGITSIPTVLVFRGGRVVDRVIGVQPRARYERALEAAGATS